MRHHYLKDTLRLSVLGFTLVLSHIINLNYVVPGIVVRPDSDTDLAKGLGH